MARRHGAGIFNIKFIFSFNICLFAVSVMIFTRLLFNDLSLIRTKRHLCKRNEIHAKAKKTGSAKIISKFETLAPDPYVE